MKGFEVLMGMFIEPGQSGPALMFSETTSRVTATPTYVNRPGCAFVTMADAIAFADKLREKYPRSEIRVREVEL